MRSRTGAWNAVLADSSSIVAAGGELLDPRDVAFAFAFGTSLAPGWVFSGARVVGGCCRVGPGHIAELASVLKG